MEILPGVLKQSSSADFAPPSPCSNDRSHGTLYKDVTKMDRYNFPNLAAIYAVFFLVRVVICVARRL
ncbi:hypothetical protein SDJN02_04948 [Cucurbita argyrosperma subsp. argyrosperma]|nr:hypothetical protein SDJN02_04948 [Cucurbita argyrosperma subsp. argyrosperma]